jgi:hypothetical protein
MDECLAYFRRAIREPEQVPLWAQWWREHEELVAKSFSMVDYVRLKHRGLVGAKQILERLGEAAN